MNSFFSYFKYLNVLYYLHCFEDKNLFPGCPFLGEPLVENEPIFLEKNKLKGWCLNPKAKRGLLFFGGNSTSLVSLSSLLHIHFPNHRIFLVPYPGYEGQIGYPSQKNLTDFSRDLYLFAKKSCEEIDVLGMSLGTGVATYLASHEKINRLVLVTPYDSMISPAQNLFPYLPIKILLRHRFPSLKWLENMFHCPSTFILGASNDEVIPRLSTEKLIFKFKKKVEHFSEMLNEPIEFPDVVWLNVIHKEVIHAGFEKISHFLNRP